MLIKKSLYVFILLLALGQLVSLSKSGGYNIYLFDVFSIFFGFFGILYFFIVKKKLSINVFLLLTVFFVFVCAFSLLRVSGYYNFSELLTSASYLIRLLSYVACAVVVFNTVKEGDISVGELFNIFLFSGCLIVLVGFIQLVVLPDFTALDPSFGWDPHKNRLASTFFDPNFTGAYLVLCIALAFEKIYTLKQKSKINYLVFGLLLVGLFLTFSRSAWAMFAVVVFIYGIFRSRTLLYVSLIIAFSAYFAVPRVQTRISGITDPADSAHFRLISWSNSLQIIKDNFLFGVGYNTYRFVQKEYSFLTPETFLGNAGAGTDSSLLFVAATTGIVGLTTFLLIFLYSVGNGFLKNNSYKVMLLAIIAGLFIESQFINSLLYPQILFFWLAVISVCLLSEPEFKG